MLFVPNMIVIPTKGRNAGKKAVIIKVLDNDYVLTSVVVRVPTEYKDSDSAAIKRKKSKFYVIIKKYSIKNIIATRYKADIGLSSIDFTGFSDDASKKKALTEKACDIISKARSEGKAKFLYTKLDF